MIDWLRRGAFVAAALALLLTFLNASWIAPAPAGVLRLVARGGIGQLPDRRDGSGPCPAAAIEPPVHNFLADTIRSLDTARRLGADYLEVDVRPTADGRLVLFPDASLDCRTDGHGPLAALTLAQLQALDPGFGYSADGGRTHPLRGLKLDRIPTVEDALASLPASRFLFRFADPAPGQAERLAAAIAAAGRDEVALPDGFTGAEAPVAAIHRLLPSAWTWTDAAAARCTADYRRWGWTSLTPASCRGGVLALSLDQGLSAWGWPDRLLARMAAARARVLITGPSSAQPERGIDLPAQLPDIPASFKGLVRVDDFWTIGPALKPDRDFRTPEQDKAAEAGLARRAAR